MRLRLAILAAVLVLGGAAPPLTPLESIRALEQQAVAAYRAKDFAAAARGFGRLADEHPGQPRYRYNLAAMLALSGRPRESLAQLERLASMRLTFALDDDFAALRGTPGFAAVEARFAASARPTTPAPARVAELPPDTIAEDLARDPRTGRLFVSSVRQRRIFVIEDSGPPKEFVHDVPWPVFALGVDANAGLLWATAGAVPEGLGYRAADDGRTALLAFDLRAGKLRELIELPPAPPRQVLGDLTVAHDGTVFVSESGQGVVYRLARGATALEPLVPRGVLVSPQTPALASDDRRLFVPDYALGIAVVDLASRAVSWLPVPADLATAGIDGLYRTGHTLIAVQNGTTPERVIRIRLDDAERRAVSWSVLVSATEGIGDPTHGVVLGSDFVFIADSGWDGYADGKPVEGKRAKPHLARVKIKDK